MPLTIYFVNSISGTDASTPKNTVFYLMALEDNPMVQTPFPVTPGTAVTKSNGLSFIQQQPPQLNPDLLFFSQGIDTSTPKNVANWIMAVNQQGATDGAETIMFDLLENAISNYRPQVGGGVAR